MPGWRSTYNAAINNEMGGLNMNRMIMKISAMAALLVLAGCASMGGGNSGIDVLASGFHSGVQDEQYHDIHNAADFKTWWDKAYSVYSSAPPLPNVDFTKQMVIAAFMGKQSHGGYIFRVVKATETDQGIDAVISIQIPGQGCNAPQAVVQPFQFVAIPASTKSVNWDVKQSYRNC